MNIAQNKREIGKAHKTIFTTDDPDIVIETWTESREVNLKKLRDRKAQLLSMQDVPVEAYIQEAQARYDLERTRIEQEVTAIDEQLSIYG